MATIFLKSMEFWLNLKTGTVAAAINMNPCTLSRSMFARCLYLPMLRKVQQHLHLLTGVFPVLLLLTLLCLHILVLTAMVPMHYLNPLLAWDHSRSQNSQMNLKLHPNAVKGIEGSKKLLDLTRSYMRKGGFHIQFNIVDSKVLKDAQKHPNNYRDLLVRVAGFTQYWVEIGKPIQDEVVARTEYEGV